MINRLPNKPDRVRGSIYFTTIGRPDVVALADEIVRIACTAAGKQPLTITWETDAPNARDIGNGVLEVVGATSEETFRCVATNVEGVDEEEITVFPAGKNFAEIFPN